MRQWRSDDSSKWKHGFGKGTDGSASINTSTDAPIDSSASGTISTTSLTATNASFSPGQIILIHQTRGPVIARKSVSSLTRSSGTATATVTSHGYATGATVNISGANQSEYNGNHVINVTDANNFTFPVSGTPTTPATGTIVAVLVNWELNVIASYSVGTITTEYPLQNTYVSSGANCAQVLVIEQHDTVTINSSQTLTAKAWNGTVGGIIAFMAKTSITVTGTIALNASGFRGGTGSSGATNSYVGTGGEGVGGYSGTGQALTNISGGSSGKNGVGPSGDGGGGGGGNGTVGGNGASSGSTHGLAGLQAGHFELVNMVFGGAGGAGGGGSAGAGPNGGRGAGILLLISPSITITGSVNGNGTNGSTVSLSGSTMGGGSGAGGSLLFKGKVVTLGSSLTTSTGGSQVGPWPGSAGAWGGGLGSVGRIHADYSGSISGTTNPTLSSRQDSSIKAGGGGGSFLFNFI